MTDPEHFIIITGGPGSGKTTLVEALAGEGLASMPEAGRSIIRHQMAMDGQALPWRDRALFAELMLAADLAAHETAQRLAGPVIFDRGIPDIAGYLTLEGLPVPGHVMRAAQEWRYGRHVFLAPPWPEIYRTDAERRQDHDTAVRTARAMEAIYTRLGYDIIPLPCVDVAARVAFVKARIAGGGTPRPA